MKIACYCQHVLGIGHFHRSLAICQELAICHETVMILGGPAVDFPKGDVHFQQLPGLRMDADFRKLIPCDSNLKLAEVKEQRKNVLWNFFKEFQPDIFLVELYPFGRNAFRFELDPILAGIASKEFAPCLRICSLRDILVEKKKKQKYTTRVLQILNNSFDGLLIHSDPTYIPLEQTFDAVEEITIPRYYTGFISSQPATDRKATNIRRQLEMEKGDKLIVASIGGGNVGGELLLAVAAAAEYLQDDPSIHFHLFTGLYSDQELTTNMKKVANPHLHIHNFSDNFQQWIENANLSISMAGYNTCINLLKADIPALLYPFAQNREQRMRVEAFTETSGFVLLEEHDLEPKHLACTIQKSLHTKIQHNRVNLDGAARSCQLLEDQTIW